MAESNEQENHENYIFHFTAFVFEIFNISVNCN